MVNRFKDVEIETNSEYYKVIPNPTLHTEDKDGIYYIYYPHQIPTYTKRLNQFYLSWNGLIFRKVNVEDIHVEVHFISELNTPSILDNELGLIAFLPSSIDFYEIPNLLSQFNLEYVSGSFKYLGDLDILFNQDITIDNKVTPFSIKETREKYLLDLTSTLAPFYTFWADYIKGQGFTFGNEYSSKDYDSTEVVLIKFNEYLQDNPRLWPQYQNEITEYTLPFSIRIRTASIAKFERLLAEMKSLKWITNIVRVPIKDKVGKDWIIPIKWDPSPSISTNDPSDVKSDGAVSFEISINGKLTTYAVRDEAYYVIEKIIKKLEYVNNKITKNN